ncbi:Hypothetical predicted protein [Mytilus galloprovincialis]|uniref:Uncharacterized protein n=1 Tax=Mytilus galloprovincialis TaxID=29158 RepID=A0A8B6DJD7_MYTGA|nr:Hypothetical predicted protein [Mytilus galloprovincialis]
MMGKPTGKLSTPNSHDYARSVVGLQGSAKINCAGPSMGNPVSFMPCWWKEGMTCLMRTWQGGDETLEDWADRVQSLATKAFRHLPEDHMYQQAIMRLCQGAADKEGGMLASNAKPKSIEEAVDKIRWHQHNHQAIYGGSARKEVKSGVGEWSPNCAGIFQRHLTVTLHLDRSLTKMGLPSRTSLGDFLRVRLDPVPVDPVKLAGGVAVFCDPKTWPRVPLRLEPGWVGAVGIHPKSAGQFEDATQHRFHQLVSHPSVSALGEVGSGFHCGGKNCTPVKSRPCDGHSSPAVLTSLWSCTFGVADWIGFTPEPIARFWRS